jgi:hypothetical membrane protein
VSGLRSGLSSGRIRQRIYSFTARVPWLGPMVWISSVLYFMAQIVVGWIWKPPYSIAHNTISDLGNTRCGLYGGSTVCSPRHVVMNIAFVFLGLVMAGGSLLIYQEFANRSRSEQRAALAGFSLMAIAGLGTILVGLFPENTFGVAHGIGAGLAIGVGNIGIFVLGLVLPLRDGMRTNMLLWAGTSLVAALLFALNHDFDLGKGTMERVAAYPETVWLIRFGLYISRNHYSSAHARNPAHLVP